MSARDSLARVALGEVGKPYDEHRDCSGFTAWCYRQIGIELPEGSVAQFGVGRPTKELLVGDLLFWDTFGEAPGHVALYIGYGEVVHAFNEQRGIIRSRVDDNMGGPYMGARRILAEPSQPEDPPGPKPPRRRKRRTRRKETR